MKLSYAMEGLLPDNTGLPSSDPQITPSYRHGLHDLVLAQQGARTQQQAAQAQDAILDLASCHSDLEVIHATVQNSVVDGQISTEAYVFADLAARATGLGPLMNLRMGPALESLDSPDAQVSMEGVTEFIKRVGDGLANVASRYAAEVSRSLAFLGTRTTMTRSSLVTLASQARHAPKVNLQGTKVKANTSKLHREGEMPDDFKGFILDVCDTINFLTTKFNSTVYNALASNAKAADALKVGNREAFYKSFEQLGQRWKDPRTQMTEKQLRQPMPGGRVLFVEGEASYSGDDATMKTLDWTINKNRFAPLNQQYTGVKNNAGEAQALTGEDVAAISEALLRALNNVDRMALAKHSWVSGIRTGTGAITALLATSSAVSGIGIAAAAAGHAVYFAMVSNGLIALARSLKTPALPGGRDFPVEIGAVKRALATLADQQQKVYFDTCALLISVAGAFVSYGKHSVEAAERLAD